MAYIAERKYPEHDILSLFPIPLETDSRIFYEEDLEEMGFLTLLDGRPPKIRNDILEYTHKLTRIKAELGFHFLLVHEELLKRIGQNNLKSWTDRVLDIYDSAGLNPAREFILQMDRHPDFVRYWGKGLSFQEIYGVLQHYVHALCGPSLSLKSSSTHHYTDTRFIYLPERIHEFPNPGDNFFLYKTMATHKVGQIVLKTYQPNPERMEKTIGLLEERHGPMKDEGLLSDLSRFLHLFPDPSLASDLYHFLETMRIESWIGRTLPGLARNMTGLKKRLGLRRIPPSGLPLKSRVMETLIAWWLTGHTSTPKKEIQTAVKRIKDLIQSRSSSNIPAQTDSASSAEAVIQIYDLMDSIPGLYTPVATVLYMGDLMPEEAEKGRRKKRESTRAKFREELAKLTQELPQCRDIRIEVPEMESVRGQRHPLQVQEIPKYLLMDGNPVPVPKGMKKIIEEIYEDLGAIPGNYLAVADDMSGHHFRDLCEIQSGAGNVLSEQGKGIHVYDEWDYRRQGYRKRWTLLRETDVPESNSSFSQDVLISYRGMIHRIKRQFERIRTDQCRLKRQKEGDHLDLDALIESIADRRAGLSPSERVFTTIRRDKRDIATAFLIDLSGSTSGWINDMERTSLLILSEALQVLKDRFAIYGFSGRTRKRCELFRIKGFNESYGDRIRSRIANLRALEYTRLGPPLRHLTRLLMDVEARTRLLITLSDGKPDDYDGYKGDYGIEDTRQALIEAKHHHIHPFCITIDKAEHSYLSHMFGAVSYAFIDDISKLPLKIPEIYRRLTT